jgi:4-carboxymuconolactone decarboxylase
MDDDITMHAARERAGDRWPDADEAFAAGLALRRSMFGAAGADEQIRAADDFMWPMQDYVTRYCFGETWTRSELPLATRSMLTLAMLVAYGRPNELRVHVQGAVANGVTPEEIREVMLHAMIYCGVPRAVEGFRVAAETLREIGAIE